MPNFEDLYGPRLNIELNSNSSLAGSPFDSTNRQRGINDGVAEFADLTECYIRQSTVACSCNTTEYRLLSSGVLSGSTDFSRLAKQGVEYHFTDSNGVLTVQSGDDFPRRDIVWLNRYEPGWRQSTTPVRTPRCYYLREDGGDLFIGITPPPKIGSSETGHLLVPFVAKPVPMTSTGDVPFTFGGATRHDLAIYHQAFPHYAAYKLLPLIGDLEGAKEQLAKFMAYVTRFLGNLRPKGGQHVTVARSYFREARRSRSDESRAWVKNQWS